MSDLVMLQTPLAHLLQDEYRRRDTEGQCLKIWFKPMGSCFFTACAQNTETMQGAMVGVAGSWHSEDRVVEGGG